MWFCSAVATAACSSVAVALPDTPAATGALAQLAGHRTSRVYVLPGLLDQMPGTKTAAAPPSSGSTATVQAASMSIRRLGRHEAYSPWLHCELLVERRSSRR